MTACAICPRTAPDGAHACQVCADELRAWLAELPHQAQLLEQFVTPSAGPAQGRLGGTGRAHAPAPVDFRVLVLLAGGRHDPEPGTDDDGTAPIAAVLAAWAGHIAYHYPAAARDAYGVAHTRPCDQAWPTGGRTISSWCAWLAGYLPFALTLPLVADYHDQVGDLVHRVRSLTHAVPRRQPMAAPCPACEAFALVRTDGHWNIVCQACGHTLDPDAYDQHAARLLATLRTPERTTAS
ncbi:hypothetical protein KVH22_29930 [Streptomyces olivaceus]|uniref:hypothetical protein n=1 Tax=Streptomyces olivaceus TaxID=47716 RepID=UPI001CCCD815|nr:hypothetical protein [Streptomyces olivaceus]MBZ6259739.1 hypothetical protein [Streptomyces olivaceus]